MGSFPETFHDPKGQSAAKSVDKTKKMTKIKRGMVTGIIGFVNLFAILKTRKSWAELTFAKTPGTVTRDQGKKWRLEATLQAAGFARASTSKEILLVPAQFTARGFLLAVR